VSRHVSFQLQRAGLTSGSKVIWMTTVSSGVDATPDAPADGSGRDRGGFLSFGNAASPWREGLAAARRHTLRVRILRGVTLTVCVAAAGIVLSAALLAPSRQMPGALSAEGVALNGTQVTLESPKISGFQLDRRPYSIKARRGVQDLARPHVIELLDIDAGIGTADEKTMQVIASRAQYDSKSEQILLDGDVRITSAAGYDLSLQQARVDFTAGTLVSDSAVSLRLDGATIAAQRMVLDDRRHVIRFDGGVKSSIRPEPESNAELAATSASSAR